MQDAPAGGIATAHDRPESDGWFVANRHYLATQVARVHAALEAFASGGARPAAGPVAWDHDGAPPALAVLCTAFALTPFERDTLLLGAAFELDAGMAGLCARAQRDGDRPYPTLGLALAALPDPHWEAIAAGARLRSAHLIELDAGPSTLTARYRVPERVWQFLVGSDVPDELTVRHGVALPPPRALAPSHDALAHEIAAAVTRAARAGIAPLVHLGGSNRADQTAVAARAARLLGRRLHKIPADGLPTAVDELDRLARVWRRDAMLGGDALLFDCHEVEGDGPRLAAVQRLVQRLAHPLFVMQHERRPWGERATLTFDVTSATLDEQRAAWRRALGQALDHADPDWIAATARRLATHAAGQLAAGGAPLDAAARADVVWDVCRGQLRSSMTGLAQPVTTAAGEHALVLPDATRAALADVEVFLRGRATLREQWGDGDASTRGRGTCVLFAGPSGVGKTFAAEVLARRLRLDLYRVDLSQIVSKYIGETEKNLRRLVDLAERGGTMLLFDEADSLFGKRTAQRDSHDRYANMETNYLLQRMETFAGVAVLTSNLAANIDPAFQRRIRFVVEFGFPGAAERAQLWRRAFPPGVDPGELDMARLAQLNVSGAAIHAIAMFAGLLAADDGGPGAAGPAVVRWRHVLLAARREYHKRGQPLTSAELAGWPV